MHSVQVARFQMIGAGLIALAMAVVVGSALGFEHIGGYVPCKLCLEQRLPYYWGIPIAVLAMTAAVFKWPAIIVRGGLFAVGLLMAYGMVLGIYHAGVEWSWWMGPADCATSSTTGLTTDANDLLGALDSVIPPACDQAAGRFLGLSFAGWNVVASLAIMVVALKFAFKKAET